MSGTKITGSGQPLYQGSTKPWETHLMPAQFFTNHASTIVLKSWAGRLCYAILEDALYVVRSRIFLSRRRDDQLERDLEWIDSRSEAEWSFEFICAHLHIDAELIRNEVNKLKEKYRG